MRTAARPFLAVLASFTLILAAAGAAAAAPPAEAGRSSGTVYMGTLGTRGPDARGTAGKPAGGKNLHSNGGAIQRAPAVYISYWGTEWNGTGPDATYTYANAITYNNDFFANVGGSPWNGIVTQYCMGVARGATSCSGVSSGNFITNPTGQLKDTWIDTTAVPSSPTQTDIANAAKRLAAHFAVATSAYANTTFMVYTPSGKSMSGFAGTGGNWCAWHSSTTNSGAPLAYAYIPYLPDAGASCGMNFINGNNAYGNGYFDGFSVVAGHEYSEAETDPFPSSGWVDRQGAENADKCAWSVKSANISLGSQVYAVQPTWDNRISGCPNVV